MVSEVYKIVKALSEKDDKRTIIFGELRCGMGDCRLKKGEKAGMVKLALYYLLSDLAYELHVDVDRDKMKRELGLYESDWKVR